MNFIIRYTCHKNHVDFRVRSCLIYFCLWHIYTAAPARLPIFFSVLLPKAEAKRGVYSQKNRHAHMTDRPRNGRRTDGRLVGRLTAFFFVCDGNWLGSLGSRKNALDRPGSKSALTRQTSLWSFNDFPLPPHSKVYPSGRIFWVLLDLISWGMRCVAPYHVSNHGLRSISC